MWIHFGFANPRNLLYVAALLKLSLISHTSCRRARAPKNETGYKYSSKKNFNKGSAYKIYFLHPKNLDLESFVFDRKIV